MPSISGYEQEVELNQFDADMRREFDHAFGKLVTDAGSGSILSFMHITPEQITRSDKGFHTRNGESSVTISADGNMVEYEQVFTDRTVEQDKLIITVVVGPERNVSRIEQRTDNHSGHNFVFTHLMTGDETSRQVVASGEELTGRARRIEFKDPLLTSQQIEAMGRTAMWNAIHLAIENPWANAVRQTVPKVGTNDMRNNEGLR